MPIHPDQLRAPLMARLEALKPIGRVPGLGLWRRPYTPEEAAAELNLSTMRMVSGAGHDAMVVARIRPVAMLFVPSRDGRSHSPEEFTAPDDCARGAAVLAGALKRLAWG